MEDTTLPQPKRPGTVEVNIKDLKDSVKEVFPQVVDKLQGALKSESKFFPSGIELIKFSIRVGEHIEFSIVIAGKDAPKIESAATAEQGLVVR